MQAASNLIYLYGHQILTLLLKRGKEDALKEAKWNLCIQHLFKFFDTFRTTWKGLNVPLLFRIAILQLEKNICLALWEDDTSRKRVLGQQVLKQKSTSWFYGWKLTGSEEGTCAANWWQISSRCISPAVGQLFSWDVSFIVKEKTSLKKQLRGSPGKPVAGSNCHSNNIYSINSTHIPFWNTWRISHFKRGAGFVLHY